MTNQYDPLIMLGNPVSGLPPSTTDPTGAITLTQAQQIVADAIAAIPPASGGGGSTFGGTLGSFRSGCWSILGNTSTGTSNTLGNGSLRLYAFVVPRTVTVTGIAAEVVTAGDVGSTVRLGIYADSDGFPGALVIDAGTIPGDAAAVASVTLSQVLQPGIYWIGGAIQGVTTTQPTMRVINAPVLPIQVFSASLPGANQNVTAVNLGGVTGALPGAGTPSTANSGQGIRCIVKVA